MAGGFAGGDAVAGRAAQYEGRITSYFILACIVGSFGGSLFGYDLGVSSGVTSMDDFLIKFFPDVYDRKHARLHETDYCKYDNQVLTLFTSSLYFAGLVSTFGASFVTKRHGRRASIMVGAVSFFLGGAMNAAAMNLAMLIVGRVLLGAGIGFGNQAVPLYLSEIAPYKIRGAVNQLFQLTTCLGILVADVVNYFTDRIHPWGWRLSLGSPWSRPRQSSSARSSCPRPPTAWWSAGSSRRRGACWRRCAGRTRWTRSSMTSRRRARRRGPSAARSGTCWRCATGRSSSSARWASQRSSSCPG